MFELDEQAEEADDDEDDVFAPTPPQLLLAVDVSLRENCRGEVVADV